MKQTELKAPEQGGILGNPRFKGVEYHAEKWFAIWDMGDILNPKTTPEIWVGYEYWDQESRDKTEKRIRFLVGVLNGLRELSELVEIP
jgi:hypothetical protein